MSSAFEFVAASGRGHGKIILLGEHAVVHGRPALAAGLSQAVQVRLAEAETGARRIPAGADGRLGDALRRAAGLAGLPDELGLAMQLEGDLPVAVGLGSSAALSVALVRALAAGSGEVLEDSQVAKRANAIEAIFHGRPSGIDVTTAALGGVLRFAMGPPLEHRALDLGCELEFLLIDTGTEHSTASTVGSLAERAAASPAVHAPLFDAIGSLVEYAEGCLIRGEVVGLGQAMTMNHGLLRTLGVSTEELDAAVAAALACGAAGAKLTGGGGGGVVLALARPQDEGLAGALADRGYTTRIARLAAGSVA